MHRLMQTHPYRQTLTHTHLHSSCHHQISGNQRYKSTHRSLGCSHRSGHTDGRGSSNTRLYLKERGSIIIILRWVHFVFVSLHPCVQVRARNQACAVLLSCTNTYVPVCACVHVNESAMWGDHLSADSLNTRAESIIMRVTTQWVPNRGSSGRISRGGTKSSAAGDVMGSSAAEANSRGWETAAALPQQNNK